MKKYIFIGIAITSLFSSCDLDLYPYNAIESTQSFQSVSDAKNWANRIHSDLRGRVYGHYILSTDIQGDQLNATIDYGNNYGAVHRWSDLTSDNYQIRDNWQGYYSALVNVNTAIEGFKTITTSTAAEEVSLKEYTGVAHLARAFYYFQLNARYAKAYDPSTASSDLSVPLVLVPDINATPSRNTVKEVYDQILADLAIAKSNLASLPGEVNADYFNIDVATALEARVKLFMHDWAGAQSAAESLISGDKYKLYNTAADIKKMWHEDASNEVIFAPFVSINEGPNTQGGTYIGWNAGGKHYVPNFLPSKWVIDEYTDDDYRKGAYFLEVDSVLLGGSYYKASLVNKYPGNPSLRNAGAVTNYAHSPKIFRIAETILIAAEASYRANNESAARTHLNKLRVARGLSALATNVSGDNLFNEIKAERFRELAFEGYRLEDLKRWGEGFTRRQPQIESIVQMGADFAIKSVAPNDLKFTWGIPDRDVVANPNIVQNPGW